MAEMSLDLNPIAHLWHDFKTAVGRRHPSNVRDLEQLAKEEWSKIPVERCKTPHSWLQEAIDFRYFNFFIFKGVLPIIKLRVPIILSSPFLEFCVESSQIWHFFSDFLVLFQCKHKK